MNRRSFAGFGLAAVGGIFVPQFGRWFQRTNERPVVFADGVYRKSGVYEPHDFVTVTLVYRGYDGKNHIATRQCRSHGGIVTVDFGGQLVPGTIQSIVPDHGR